MLIVSTKLSTHLPEFRLNKNKTNEFKAKSQTEHTGVPFPRTNSNFALLLIRVRSVVGSDCWIDLIKFGLRALLGDIALPEPRVSMS